MAKTRTGLQIFFHRPASASNQDSHSDSIVFGQGEVRLREDTNHLVDIPRRNGLTVCLDRLGFTRQPRHRVPVLRAANRAAEVIWRGQMIIQQPIQKLARQIIGVEQPPAVLMSHFKPIPVGDCWRIGTPAELFWIPCHGWVGEQVVQEELASLRAWLFTGRSAYHSAR